MHSKVNNETQKILTNLQPWEKKHEDFKRILVVTHGGYIMEFYNVMKQINGQKISNSNCAKNCAVFIFGVEKDVEVPDGPQTDEGKQT